MKIVFAASSGGHYEQLLMLKPLMEKYESVLVTEKTDYSAGNTGIKTYYMCQINRKEPLVCSKIDCKFLEIIGADHKGKTKSHDYYWGIGCDSTGPSDEIVWRKADIYRIICQGMFQKSDWQFVISFRGSVLCAVGRNAEIISQGNLQRGNILDDFYYIRLPEVSI